jgi:hypothetical protein
MMRASCLPTVIVTAISLVVVGCQTPAPEPSHQGSKDGQSPFLAREEYPERLLGIQDVLAKHRFDRPWIAVRGEDASTWFVAERLGSGQRFDRIYVHITAGDLVTASITPYDFVINGWASLGKLFVDPDPEARTIAVEIARRLKETRG